MYSSAGFSVVVRYMISLIRAVLSKTALVLKVSPTTVIGDWRLAKAWLQREMRGGRSHDA